MAKQGQQPEYPYVVIDVIGSETADRLWLFEVDGTTTGFDSGWDAQKIIEDGFIQIFATDGELNKYQVSVLPELNNLTLGIIMPGNESYVACLTVSPEIKARRMYLHDMYTKEVYPLRDNAKIYIQGTQDIQTNRFRVLKSSQLSDVEKVDLFSTYINKNVLTVENHSDISAEVSVFDISGRTISQARLGVGEIKSFTELSSNTIGIIIVKVESDNGEVLRWDKVLF